jgi:hypothetical protein
MSQTGEKFKTGYVRFHNFDLRPYNAGSIGEVLTAFCQENKVIEVQHVTMIDPKRYLVAYLAEDDETKRRERNADVRLEVPEVPKNGNPEEEPAGETPAA